MDFKTWLLSEGLQNYVKGDHVDLYHYSEFLTGDEEILDPEQFGKNPITRAERRALHTPRVFFYLNPEQKEDFFNDNLYKTSVPVEQIYDLEQDPRNVKRIFPDMGRMMVLATENGEKGVYYNNGMDIVIWFDKIKVRRVNKEKNDVSLDK